MKRTPIEKIAGENGTLICTGVGPHTVDTRMIQNRTDDTVIAAMTIDGVAATCTDYFPTGTKLYKSEILTFAGRVTSITLTNATDSITVIKN